MDATNFRCETLNKNWNSIIQHGKQKTTRLPRPYTYINDNIKKGVIMGTLMRITKQNTYMRGIAVSMAKAIIELHKIGYDNMFIHNVLTKLKKKPLWKKMAVLLTRLVHHANYPNNILQFVERNEEKDNILS